MMMGATIHRVFFGAIICHLVWGTQPVLTRFIQTKPAEPLNKMSVVCLTQFMSSLFAVSASSCRRSAVYSPNASSQSSVWKFYGFAFLYGLVTALRAGTNFLSAGLTSSWHISMVAMLSPFVTALISRCILNERLDVRVWPSVVVATLGGALVLYAEEKQQQHRDSHRYSTSAGISLQFISIFFSGTARVLMKLTAGTYSSTQLMIFQYVVTIFLSLSFSLFSTDNPKSAWSPWLHVSMKIVIAALTLSFCIQWAAAESQVILIRHLSPAIYTCFQPLRIVSTVFVGSILLKESVQGYRQWVGLLLVLIAVATFLTRRILWPREHSSRDNNSIEATTELVKYKLTSANLDRNVAGVLENTDNLNQSKQELPRTFPPILRRHPQSSQKEYTVVPTEDSHDGFVQNIQTTTPLVESQQDREFDGVKT